MQNFAAVARSAAEIRGGAKLAPPPPQGYMVKDRQTILVLRLPVDCLNLSYSTGQKKGFSYLVGNLVATNWPIEKALHAIGCNQIWTK